MKPGEEISSEADITGDMISIYNDLDALIQKSKYDQTMDIEDWSLEQAVKISEKYHTSTNRVIEIYVKVYNIKHNL